MDDLKIRPYNPVDEKAVVDLWFECDLVTPKNNPRRDIQRKLKVINSSIISYIMTINGPEPIENKSSPIDYDHYIEKQLKPIADSVLVFYDQKFEDILTGTEQKTLFGY